MASTTLMNVSVKCEYALRAVFELALRAGSEPTRIADIAQRQNIPQKFLESILAELKKSGFLESKRGAEGGYMLGRAPELITVGEVLRAVEGGRVGRATLEAGGSLDFFWERVDAAVAEIIDRTSFADLVREWRERQAQFVPNWEI
ncbi:MAG: Rrf2 family transcriptional regulator [Bryobacteraceae bacterium]|nr:Rrf2 family transcriptional regulator [Bryobacteraceae bacterium]MCX7603740.1 Rrf2 family transcriptional regulator [Bryobacteraceae bacterium]